MFLACVLALSLAAAMPDQPPFPLRTDPPPKEWKAHEINDGLPYRWEKGDVHVLAWEVIEDDRPWKFTQILVLKKFDKPTEKGGYKWVLAQLYHDPEDNKWPWRGPRRIPPPVPRGERMPKLTDAQLFGHEFYNDPPTDKQIETFLRETDWTPTLGMREHFTLSDKAVVARPITTTLTTGGIDPAGWKKLFKRDVPTNLFPELKKMTDKKK